MYMCWYYIPFSILPHSIFTASCRRVDLVCITHTAAACLRPSTKTLPLPKNCLTRTIYVSFARGLIPLCYWDMCVAGAVFTPLNTHADIAHLLFFFFFIVILPQFLSSSFIIFFFFFFRHYISSFYTLSFHYFQYLFVNVEYGWGIDPHKCWQLRLLFATNYHMSWIGI